MVFLPKKVGATLASDKTTAQGTPKPSLKRGGSRPGSGRPTVYSLLEKMAIALRVAEIRIEHQCSKSEAIRKLQASGELPLHGVSNIGRYLSPKYLNPKIAAHLADAPNRIGIVAGIPMPNKSRAKRQQD
jgi:hypothetical protein